MQVFNEIGQLKKVLLHRPGTVVVYDRNHITNEILKDHRIEVLEIPSATTVVTNVQDFITLVAKGLHLV